ncbi:hypothetical protein AGMMS49950_10410 [Endomicrobiia bacterium]|nr:hypothetical protein AGMMS49950_10410 [Endomicrobiia bacterium]
MSNFSCNSISTISNAFRVSFHSTRAFSCSFLSTSRSCKGSEDDKSDEDGDDDDVDEELDEIDDGCDDEELDELDDSCDDEELDE